MKFSFPKILLHLEGLTVLVASVFLYFHFGGGWVMFLVLILAPDIGLLGYLAGKKTGSITYNTLHFYALPMSCIAYHLLTGQGTALFLASFVWTAHIGMDRFFGFGLKYQSLPDSHLQKV